MRQNEPGPWEKELDDFIRAFSGAFLFGTPLLFTMEMWWLGTQASPGRLLAFLGLAFAASLGLAHISGFKRESTFRGNLDQAIDAVAVGIVASVIILLVLNRFSLADPLDTILGKIIVQTLPLSVGASLANAVLGPGRGRQGNDESGRDSSYWQATWRDVGATFVGAILLSFAIAPTEEVPMLASELTSAHLIALVGLSLLLTYLIVFESGFDPQERRGPSQGLFQTPVSETLMAYVVSLGVSLVALHLFSHAEIGDPPMFVLAQALVLGVPTAIGGAAGRLVL